MIWEALAALAVLLFLFYLFLEIKDSLKLKKLRRNYDEDGNESKPGKPDTKGSPGPSIDTLKREQSPERNVEPEAGGVLQTPNGIVTFGYQRQPDEDISKIDGERIVL